MGQAKALMMEMEETDWEFADVSFYCHHCRGQREGTAELPVVYEDGDEIYLPVVVQCSTCGTDYNGWVRTNWEECSIELDDFPEVKIDADPVQGSYRNYDDYDHEYFEWIESQEANTRPLRHAFRGTLQDVESLAESVASDQRSQMLARMLLSQSITALEVFLSDTLTLAVRNRRDVQEKLLGSRSLGIGSTQFKLEDTIGIENFSQEKLLSHLNSVSFHNLEKVSKLFQIGLGIEILPKDDSLSTIKRAVRMRHDCVHRNGIDKETGVAHVITKEFLIDLSLSLLAMVNSVDKKVELQTSVPNSETDPDF